MSKNLEILIFNQYYLPGFKAGGPIRSISNLVEYLSGKYEFYIVTSDRDSGDDFAYPEIKRNEWVKVGKANVFYSSTPLTRSKIKFLLKERNYDRLYLNSFFSFRFSILPLLLNRNKLKTIIAPRGEFSQAALKLKSFKKNIYLKGSIFSGLYKNVIWQASSKYEFQDISRIIKDDLNIKIAHNFPQILPTTSNSTKFNGSLHLVLISRISPMKNLLYAFRVLSKVKIRVVYNLYGSKDELYWEKCEPKIAELPDNIQVKYHGSVPNDEVHDVISKNHLFFLPTLGENFGQAIAASLSCG